MFEPDWEKGHNMLGRDGPVEVPLPEDNTTIFLSDRSPPVTVRYP